MKKETFKNPGFWISVVGTIVMATFFGLWYRDNINKNMPAKISAVVSVVMFTILCLRFVPQWMKFWSPLKSDEEVADSGAVRDEEPQHMGLKIFKGLLLVNITVLILVYILRRIFGYSGNFFEGITFWRRADGAHYLDIAREWYLSEGEWDRIVQLVFLPGYPLVVRLVNTIMHNALYSGMMVSACSFAGAGCVTYRLLRLDYSHQTAIRTIRYLCLLPGVFFFVAPMSESLFLLLCVSCLYFVRKDKWLAGCLLGAMAAFTRSLGLALCVPVFFELMSQTAGTWEKCAAKKQIRRFAGRFLELMLIPAGFGVYCFINYLVSGNFFQFMEYQRAHWYQNLGWFFNTAAYQLEYALKCWPGKLQTLYGLWLPNLAAGFFSLALMIPAVKKLRPSYTAWFLVYYLIAMGATWLLSAPRYMLVLLPIPMAMAQLSKKPFFNVLLTIASAVAAFLYLYAFVCGWSVW